MNLSKILQENKYIIYYGLAASVMVAFIFGFFYVIASERIEASPNINAFTIFFANAIVVFFGIKFWEKIDKCYIIEGLKIGFVWSLMFFIVDRILIVGVLDLPFDYFLIARLMIYCIIFTNFLAVGYLLHRKSD